MATVYKSKIDRWLVFVLVGAMALSVGAVAVVLASGEPHAWSGALIACLGVVLPPAILLSTSYTMEDRQLVVRSGLFRWKIPLAEITAITPTSSILSSPALSFDRLRIDYGPGRSLMISPADRERFLSELASKRGVHPNNSSKPTPLRGAA